MCDQAAAVLRNRLAGKQQQVYVAGHGVGGALAAVFALYLHFKHPLLAAHVSSSQLPPGLSWVSSPAVIVLALAVQTCIEKPRVKVL